MWDGYDIVRECDAICNGGGMDLLFTLHGSLLVMLLIFDVALVVVLTVVELHVDGEDVCC